LLNPLLKCLSLILIHMKSLIILLPAIFIVTLVFGQKSVPPGNLAAWKAAKWEAKPLTDAEKKSKPAQFDNVMGKAQYVRACKACHGEKGLGDGTKAPTLKTFPGDFSSIEFQRQTDEVIFWKTKYGGADMPKYVGKVDDETIWNMVSYMRNFKK